MNGAQAAASESKAPRTGFSLALVFLAAVAVYAPTLFAGFTNWDDPKLLLNNPNVALATQAQWLGSLTTYRTGNGWPLQILSYAVEYRLWGLHPLGYHLTNVVLHGLCAALLWLVVHAISGTSRAATAGALLFALHPAGAEVVSWVSERSTLLGAAFMLASLLAYLRAEGERAWRMGALATLLFVLAAASKVAVAPFPVILALLHVCRRTRLNAPRSGTLLLCLAASVASGLATVHGHAAQEGLHGPHGGTLFSHLRLMAVVFERYATKILFPVRLSPYYDFRASEVTLVPMIVGALIAAGAIASTIILVLRRRTAGFWAAGAWLLWLPASNLLLPISTPMADRYLYLPLLFLAPLAVAALSPRMPEGDPCPARALVAVIVLFGLLAAKQGTYWASSLRLWTHATRVEPDNPWVWQKRAATLLEEGRAAVAIPDARRAVRIHPRWLEGWETLGQAGLRSGDAETAEEAFRQEVGLAPNAVSAYLGIGHARAMKGDPRAALAAYARALDIKRDYRESAEALAFLAREKGLAREALAVLPDRPTSVWIELARGDLLASLGREDEAGRIWREILKARPGFEPALERLRRGPPPLHNRVDAGKGAR